MKEYNVGHKFKSYYNRQYIPLFSNLNMLHNVMCITKNKQ